MEERLTARLSSSRFFPLAPARVRSWWGSKNLTEQVILGEILAQLLESQKRAGRSTAQPGRDLHLSSGHPRRRHRCVRGVHRHRAHRHPEGRGERRPEAVYRRVSEVYEKDLALAWTEPFGFDNTFAIAMKSEEAERLGIRKISDLKAHERTLRARCGA